MQHGGEEKQISVPLASVQVVTAGAGALDNSDDDDEGDDTSDGGGLRVPGAGED